MFSSLLVCEDKEETGGCEAHSGPCCFSLSPVSQMHPYLVWLDIAHHWNGL